MLPYHHAGVSAAVSIVYVSGRALFFDRVQSIPHVLGVVLIGTVLGAIVDSDHGLWSLILNPKRCLKYLATLNISGFYLDLTRPSGYYYQRIVALNVKYPLLFFAFHGVWLILVGMVVYFSTHPFSPYNDYVPLYILVLAVHYISDFFYWRMWERNG